MIIRIFILLFICLNVNGCATWKTPIRKECKQIIKENTYIKGEFDCKQFAPITEEALLKLGYDAEAVVGWYTFAASREIKGGRHAFVRLIYNGKKYAVDTSGEKPIIQKEGYSVFNFHNYEVLRTLEEDKKLHKWVYR